MSSKTLDRPAISRRWFLKIALLAIFAIPWKIEACACGVVDPTKVARTA